MASGSVSVLIRPAAQDAAVSVPAVAGAASFGGLSVSVGGEQAWFVTFADTFDGPEYVSGQEPPASVWPSRTDSTWRVFKDGSTSVLFNNFSSSRLWRPATTFDHRVRARVKTTTGESDIAGVIVRVLPNGDSIGFELVRTATENKWVLYLRQSGLDTEVQTVAPAGLQPDAFYEVGLSVVGGAVSATVGGVVVASHTLTSGQAAHFAEANGVGIVNFLGTVNFDWVEVDGSTVWPAAGAVGFTGDEGSLTVVNSTASAQAVVPNSTWDTSFPGAACWTISAANPVIENVKVQGGITFTSSMDTFTMRNCVVELNGSFHWNARIAWEADFTSFVMTDTTVRFSSGNPLLGSAMVGGSGGPDVGGTIARCDLSGGSDIVSINGPSYLVEDTHIHDVYIGPLSGQGGEMSHSNAFHCYHNSGLTIRRCRVDGPDVSGAGSTSTGADADIFMPVDAADIATVDCVIEDNRLFGGHYGMVLEQNARRLRVRRNLFPGGYQYGTVSKAPAAEILEWVGNVGPNGDPLAQP